MRASAGPVHRDQPFGSRRPADDTSAAVHSRWGRGLAIVATAVSVAIAAPTIGEAAPVDVSRAAAGLPIDTCPLLDGEQIEAALCVPSAPSAASATIGGSASATVTVAPSAAIPSAPSVAVTVPSGAADVVIEAGADPQIDAAVIAVDANTEGGATGQAVVQGDVGGELAEVAADVGASAEINARNCATAGDVRCVELEMAGLALAGLVAPTPYLAAAQMVVGLDQLVEPISQASLVAADVCAAAGVMSDAAADCATGGDGGDVFAADVCAAAAVIGGATEACRTGAAPTTSPGTVTPVGPASTVPRAATSPGTDTTTDPAGGSVSGFSGGAGNGGGGTPVSSDARRFAGSLPMTGAAIGAILLLATIVLASGAGVRIVGRPSQRRRT
jgi:hypothetical protein